MRRYIVDLVGGTATASVQMTESGTIQNATLSFLSAAVGKIEISRSPASQIGTAQPTADVLARVNCSATAGNVALNIPLSEKAKAFEYLYVHQTGAGNLGNITFS